MDVAARYPEAMFICGHIGGGGDWEWQLKALRVDYDIQNHFRSTVPLTYGIWFHNCAVGRKETGPRFFFFPTEAVGVLSGAWNQPVKRRITDGLPDTLMPAAPFWNNSPTGRVIATAASTPAVIIGTHGQDRTVAITYILPLRARLLRAGPNVLDIWAKDERDRVLDWTTTVVHAQAPVEVEAVTLAKDGFERREPIAGQIEAVNLAGPQGPLDEGLVLAIND